MGPIRRPAPAIGSPPGLRRGAGPISAVSAGSAAPGRGPRDVATSARSAGSATGAKWDEIDIEAATWTLPAERMKANRPHRVPLSDRALEVLDEARALGDTRGLVFPGPKTGRPMFRARFSQLLKELRIPAVPHGFRSSFRDWASERTNAPHAVMEAALAHTNPNEAEAVYARSDLFDKRRELMDTWARYLNPALAPVVSLDAHARRAGRKAAR